MIIQLILNGQTRRTQVLPDGADQRDAKKLALAAAIKAGEISISEALQVEFTFVSGTTTASSG